MNALMLIDNIEKRLRQKREPIVFPLTPTHRKELRQLRDKNIGELSNQLSTIKQLKKEEYIKKYAKDIEKKFNDKQKVCDKLNTDWGIRIGKIVKLLKGRKELEKATDIKFLTLSSDYNNIRTLKISDLKRKFSIDKENVSKAIAEENFNKKYGANFSAIQKKIVDIVTKYEEAINFGDLEIVKELYYIMKTSNKLFEKIEKLEV